MQALAIIIVVGTFSTELMSGKQKQELAMQDGAGAGAEAQGGILQTLLADCEEQARQLGEMIADDDPWSRTEHYRGAARRLQCTLGKALAVARAVEAAAPASSSRGTDSPRSAGGTVAAVEAQERQSMCKRRCARSLLYLVFHVLELTLSELDFFHVRTYWKENDVT